MSRRSRGYRPAKHYDPRRGTRGGYGRPSAAASLHRDGTAGREPASPERTPLPDAAPLPPLPDVPAAPLAARRTRPGAVSADDFAVLGLGQNLVRALAELGATRPFAIQAVTIPDILAGHHVLGRGRTGSGKTIAFGAGLVERVLRLKSQGAFPADPPRAKPTRGSVRRPEGRQAARAPKALILAPTRELALQIDRTVQPLARSVGLFTGQFVGGVPFDPQLHALARGVDIVIGTPGRIEDLAARGHLSLGQVAVTVVDEADHLADLGFIDSVQRVLRRTRRRSQRLLFSATLDARVTVLVEEFMPRPAVHEIVDANDEGAVQSVRGAAPGAAPGDAVGDVRHDVLIVLREHKADVLRQLAGAGERTIIFCRTRAYADRVADDLTAAGVRAAALHGNLGQARRERNLARFASGAVDVLVATDVAARGIHIDDVAVVVQADPPDDATAYVHRAGRTGRVGRSGRVITVIARTRQQRTRQLFAELGRDPDSFGEFSPGDSLPG